MTVISRLQTWDSLISHPASLILMILQISTLLVLEHMVCVISYRAFSDLIDNYLGAPETFRSHEDTEAVPLRITREVDIWSIGCVFSEASVWAHHGWKKVIEYRRQRSVEIGDRGGSEGEHAFHYDGRILNAVYNIHQDIVTNATAKDHITRSVLDRLVEDMLQHKARPDAKFVFEKSKRLIGECVKKFEVTKVELRDTNGELGDLSEARTATRSPRSVPSEHYRSPSERELPLEEPLPPNNSSTPSSSSSKSQSPPHRPHHQSISQSSIARGVGGIVNSQPTGQSSPFVPNPPAPTSTAANIHESSSQQRVQQFQEELVRPTLSIDEGHAWKEKRKNGGIAVLPGGENLTALDQRDHVSHIHPRLEPADRSF